MKGQNYILITLPHNAYQIIVLYIHFNIFIYLCIEETIMYAEETTKLIRTTNLSGRSASLFNVEFGHYSLSLNVKQGRFHGSI